MVDVNEVGILIDELAAALRRYDKLRFDEVQSRELGPPATADELAHLSQVVGFVLPPSWRAFLSLHNGWSNFRGTAKLLSTADRVASWVNQRIQDWEDLLEGQLNPFGDGRQPVLLGIQESSFLVVDPATVRPDGEMSFIMYDYLKEEHRFPDLTSYLRHHLLIMHALVARQDRAPGGKN
jgi:hypothetical protein